MTQKKGILYRLSMGRDDQADFTANKLPGSRWAVFWDVMKGKTFDLVKVNLLVILFALPAIIWFMLISVFKNADALLVPYSANIGIGYPTITDAVIRGSYSAFMFEVWRWLIMIPLIAIAGLGLAGAFYVIKQMVWGEGVSIFTHFFKGIKQNWLPFLLSFFILGIFLFFVIFNIGAYSNLPQLGAAVKIVGIVVSVLVLAVILLMLIFVTTQGVTYKLKFGGLLKNSFIFGTVLVPLNLLILAISAIPIVLLLVLPSFLSTIMVVFFLLLGISFIILLWTVYGQWVFDKYLNGNIEGAQKNRGMYVSTEEDESDKELRDSKTRNIKFINPKKKKKIISIEDGKTFTPLQDSFSRADLEKLAKEKNALKASIDLENTEDKDVKEEDNSGV